MQQRCYNKNNPRYQDWGGRGIQMCEAWLGKNGFYNFVKDVEETIGTRPQGYTLDRINNSKGYSKNNIRWATPSEQNYNRRRLPNKTNKTNISYCEHMKNKYRVLLYVNSKTVHIGYYKNISLAVAARDRAIKELLQ